MKHLSMIIFLSFYCLLCFSKGTKISFDIYDTIKKENTFKDSLINEVIENSSLPKKETVELINSFTKYGFKNLFTQFNYNSTLPYSSQINPNAELFMSDYLKNHKAGLLELKKYAVPYFNLIDNILTQYGLPKELKYLAVIESSLQTTATSNVGAAGPWQFMPETGRNYGLIVNRYKDDRRDYFKSTHAASKFLLKLYSEFKDWLLVIAAYNCGPGRVDHAIKKCGSNDFWKLQYYLPLESRNHVKKFITTHYIMESNHNDFYSDLSSNKKRASLSDSETLNIDTILVSGKYRSNIIIKNIEIKSDLFQKYNPEFDQTITSKGEYKMILPKEKMILFKKNKYEILKECVEIALSE